jgi:hypothetical protein
VAVALTLPGAVGQLHSPALDQRGGFRTALPP